MNYMFDLIVKTEFADVENGKNIPIGISALFSIYDDLTEEQKKSFNERLRVIAENIRR